MASFEALFDAATDKLQLLTRDEARHFVEKGYAWFQPWSRRTDVSRRRLYTIQGTRFSWTCEPLLWSAAL